MENKGFSVVEVAAILTLLGILAAIAFPAYQLFTTRAKIAEGLALSGPAKNGVASFYQSTGEFPDSNGAAGVADASAFQGNYVSSVKVGPGGKITISYVDDRGPPLDGQNVELTPQAGNGSIIWDCDSGLIPPRYLPPECKRVDSVGIAVESPE